jgi:hypothetical protein
MSYWQHLMTIYTIIVTNLCNPTEFRVYISQSDGLSEKEKIAIVSNIEADLDDIIS